MAPRGAGRGNPEACVCLSQPGSRTRSMSPRECPVAPTTCGDGTIPDSGLVGRRLISAFVQHVAQTLRDNGILASEAIVTFLRAVRAGQNKESERSADMLMNDEGESAPEATFSEQDRDQEETPLAFAGVLSPPPARACLVCRQRAWKWNAERAMYECTGAPEIHAEYARWSHTTFPWLQGEEKHAQ